MQPAGTATRLMPSLIGPRPTPASRPVGCAQCERFFVGGPGGGAKSGAPVRSVVAKISSWATWSACALDAAASCSPVGSSRWSPHAATICPLGVVKTVLFSNRLRLPELEPSQ